jgi:RNA polymerase sigma-70 factor (ECF subfamily)
MGRGDRKAAEALVRALAPKAHRIAWRLLRDEAEAEDVTQDALTRLWRIAPRWTPGQARVDTWMHKVVTNLCFDRLRKAGRMVEEDKGGDPGDEAPLADTLLVAGDTRSRVDRALDALPARQKAALVLTHYEELSAAEAGAVLGVSVEAVESLLSRARRALREALAGEKKDLFAALAAVGAGGA